MRRSARSHAKRSARGAWRALPGWGGRAARVTLTMAVLAASTLVAVTVLSGPATYPIEVVFARTPGLFAGASVEVLGVPVGTVTSVENVGNQVMVRMAVDDGRAVPADAVAALVSPELLGEPDIELDPGYTGGPRLAAGSVIGESRTRVPVSTDQLLQALEHFLRRVDPHAVASLVDNLASDLDGQGAQLNNLIASAAGTLQLLADKGDDLGRLNGTLAQLTGSLDTRTSQLDQLIADYDTVSGTLAQHGQQLGDALTQLTGASSQLVSLLTPNLLPLEADVGTVTTAGRTLDRNLSSVDEVLSSATLLFTAAQRAYDPTYNWLNLNAQVAPGLTAAYLAGLVRDRLAGVCRRIAANHATGLSASALSTLAQCGNPSSGFFDPIINQFTTILGSLSSGATGQTSASTALMQGLAEVPGLGPAVAAAGGSSAASAPAAPSSPAPAAPPSPSSPSSSPSSGSGSSGGSGSSSGSGCLPVVGSLLGCGSGSGSGSSSSGSSGSDSSGSSNGLLSYRTPLAAPSLVAPAARLLPDPNARPAHLDARHHPSHHRRTPVHRHRRSSAAGSI